jgi:hypothetical protein
MAYSRLSEALYKAAQSWAGKWTKYANERLVSSPTEGVPKSLRGIIKISTKADRKSAQRFSLILTAEGHGSGERAKYGHGAEIAKAYEYGARPHIIAPIPPKNVLTFYWQKIDDAFVGKSVKHPGIEAAYHGQGYIYWSRYRLLKEGKAELTSLGRKAILADLKSAFTQGKRK